jgi:hypothetical protein
VGFFACSAPQSKSGIGFACNSVIRTNFTVLVSIVPMFIDLSILILWLIRLLIKSRMHHVLEVLLGEFIELIQHTCTFPFHVKCDLSKPSLFKSSAFNTLEDAKIGTNSCIGDKSCNNIKGRRIITILWSLGILTTHVRISTGSTAIDQEACNGDFSCADLSGKFAPLGS